MDEVSRLVIFLPAADHQLIVFKRDLELLASEASQCERDAQGLESSAAVAVAGGNPFNVVRGIAVATLADSVDQPFHFLKTQQQRAGQHGNARHNARPSSKRPLSVRTPFPRTGRSHGTDPWLGRRPMFRAKIWCRGR